MDAPGQLVQLLGRRLAPPLREQLARRGNGGWIASQHQVDLADERGRIRLLDPVCPRQVPFGAREARTCVRQRVHALQRVYPLTYARARLTGTERDLARAHGVERADAATLISQVDLVLRRDPTAVASARELLA